MRHRLFLIPVALTLLGSGPPTVPLRPLDDFARLQGKWKLVGAELNGRSVLSKDSPADYWVFRGDRLTTGSSQEFQFQIALAQGWLRYWNDQITNDKALYRIRGDVLQIYWGTQFRPRDFHLDGAGQKTFLFTFRRVKSSGAP